MAILVSLPVWLVATLLGLWAIMILRQIADNDLTYQANLRLVLFAIVLLFASTASGWLALYITRNA